MRSGFIWHHGRKGEGVSNGLSITLWPHRLRHIYGECWLRGGWLTKRFTLATHIPPGIWTTITWLPGHPHPSVWSDPTLRTLQIWWKNNPGAHKIRAARCYHLLKDCAKLPLLTAEQEIRRAAHLLWVGGQHVMKPHLLCPFEVALLPAALVRWLQDAKLFALLSGELWRKEDVVSAPWAGQLFPLLCGLLWRKQDVAWALSPESIVKWDYRGTLLSLVWDERVNPALTASGEDRMSGHNWQGSMPSTKANMGIGTSLVRLSYWVAGL